MNQNLSPTPTSPLPPRGHRATLVALGRELLPALIATGVAGFLVGGIGGRLAMFVLRLTSGPEVIGLESDDGFVIGRLSLDTLGLVVGVSILSMLLIGPAYALFRIWLPARWLRTLLTAFFALVGGATLVHTDGLDFVVLSPRPLAIMLFVAIPAAFGATLEPLRGAAERWTPRVPAVAVLLTLPFVLGLPIVMGAGFIGLGIGAVAGGALLLMPLDRVERALRSPPVAWAGRLALGGIAGLAASDLLGDVRTLLTLA